MARMTKEELREDPVLEWIQGAISFTQRNARWLLTGLIVVVAVLIGAMTLSRSHQRSQRDAAQVLMDAQRRFLEGAYPAAEVQLQELLDRYPRTSAAPIARIYLGDALLAQERAGEALDVYEMAARTAGKDALLTGAAHRGKAAALESLGRPAEASASYAAAAELPSSFQRDDLLNAGRTALEADDPARAQQLLERARELAGGATAEIEFYLAQAQAAQR